jgi:hypothetical protein
LFDLVTFKIVQFVFFVSVKFRHSPVFAPWSHVGRGCFYLVLMAAALLADPWLCSHRWTAALVAVLVGGYGYGAGLEVNALLDLSTPINYPVVGSSKRVSSGKSTNYHLGLAP